MNIQSLHEPYPQQPSAAHPSAQTPTQSHASSTENIIGLLGFLPSSWQGSDESLRHALSYRAEEERRRAEEERTKQEEYRLELRKRDLELLREGIRYGIPPSMMPFIFIGNGVTGATAEWIRDYVARIWQQQQQEIAAATAAQAASTVSTPGGPDVRNDPRYNTHHHRSQSAQSIPSLQHSGGLLPGLAPPPPPCIPPAPAPSRGPPLPTLVTAASQTAPSQEQISPGGSQGHQAYHGHGAAVTPPLQVRQVEFPTAKSGLYRSSPPPQPTRSPSPPPPLQSQSQSQSQQQQQQPTLQFHHWQPNSGSAKDRVPGGKEGPQNFGDSSRPPPLGNGIPRSPTRSLLNIPQEDSSPKRRRQTSVFDAGTPKQHLPPSSSGLQHASGASPKQVPTSLPPISSLSANMLPRKRGSGHTRHRSEASLHGYEPYARPSSTHFGHGPHQLAGPAILNPSSSASTPRGGLHRRTESSWESGSVDVLAAAAESERQKELSALREQHAAEQARRSG
ncbi:uncharacterized protein V2V93DRAFT_357409 [Kockiozyma suomiensis]|uniref:uncharacterized protein n=1 Tax=Kockiozyma suomiensis TaxID=1337062 RepID=UPI003342EAB3